MKKTAVWHAIPTVNPVCTAGFRHLLPLYMHLKNRSRVFEKKIVWKGEALDLTPGQFIFGRYSVAGELDMNPSTIRDQLYRLAKLGIVEKIQDLIGASVWAFIDDPLSQKSQKIDDTKREPASIQGSPASATTEIQSYALNNKKTTIAALGWIEKEEDLVVSSKIVEKADESQSLQRFGEHAPLFLEFLKEKARRIATENPIGLILHWLKTGKMTAAFYDVLKVKKAAQEAKKRQILDQKRRLDEERQRDHQRLESLTQQQIFYSRPEQALIFQDMTSRAQRDKFAGRFIKDLDTAQILADLESLDIVLTVARQDQLVEPGYREITVDFRPIGATSS